VEVYGKHSSGWRRWLTLLDGIFRVVLKLETRWVPDVGSQSPKALTPDTERSKV
jgi:hypothetical protein